MPEDNNFHDMIVSWRLRSGEIENSSLLSMSGSSEHESPYKHKEDSELLPDKPKASCSVAGPITGTALLTSDVKEELNKGDKNEILPENSETEKKVDAGDKNVDNENKIIATNLTSTKEKEAADNTDSIYMKQRRYLPDTAVPTSEEKEEDCGVVCLFYVMQCCDCVIA